MTIPRVYITGLGLLTAAGQTPEANFEALLTGSCYLQPIQGFDLPNWPGALGGELLTFDPAKHLPDRKLLKLMSRQDTFGLFVAAQALAQSQMLSYRHTLPDPTCFNERTGIYVGSPGNKYLQQYDFLSLMAQTGDDMQAFAHQLSAEVHPMWLLRILPNNVLAYVGMQHGFKGPNHNITNHAIGGMQALLEAYHAIRSGEIDRAVVVGYDLGIEPQAIFYYDALGLLSHEGIKPFDVQHDGTVLADGGAALIIESEASVREREALCLAEIGAIASHSEGAGLFGLTPSGEPLAALITQVLQQAHSTADQCSMIIAHGNGSKASDDSEARALCSVFGPFTPPVSAFKWSMGHTLVASGLVDTILAIFSLRARMLPGIATLTTPHQVAGGLNLSVESRSLESGHMALIINRGFASMNACLAIQTCDPVLS